MAKSSYPDWWPTFQNGVGIFSASAAILIAVGIVIPQGGWWGWILVAFAIAMIVFRALAIRKYLSSHPTPRPPATSYAKPHESDEWDGSGS